MQPFDITANIITLPPRKDRHTLIVKELVEHKINARFWWGEVAPFNVYNGISRAHKQIVRYAKHIGLKQVLILEDDCHFTSPNAFKYFIENIPEYYDLYLASIYWGEISTEKTVKDFCGMTCYIVHERFYDTFLETKESMDIDRSFAGKGKYVVCYPFAAIQHETRSDHHSAVMDYSKYLVGRELYNL